MIDHLALYVTDVNRSRRFYPDPNRRTTLNSGLLCDSSQSTSWSLSLGRPFFMAFLTMEVSERHARARAITRDTHSPLQIAPFEGPEMRRETPRVSVLVCPFCVRDLLSVLKTPNGGTWMRVISTLNLKPAPGSSSPEAAAHERYRVGLHAVADLAGSSGRRPAVSCAGRPSWRAPWSLQASSCASASTDPFVHVRFAAFRVVMPWRE